MSAWQLQQPRLLAAWLGPTILWLALRFLTPKDGMMSHSISRTPGLSRYLLFMFAWGSIAIAGIFAFQSLKALIPAPVIVGTTLLMLWYAGMFCAQYLEDRRRHSRDLENSVGSAASSGVGYPSR